MDLTVNNNRLSFNALRIRLYNYGSRNKPLNEIINGYRHIEYTNPDNKKFATLFFWTDNAENFVAERLWKMNISYDRCDKVDKAPDSVKYFWTIEGRMPTDNEAKNITNILKSKGIVIPADTRLPSRLSARPASDLATLQELSHQ